MIFKKTDKKVIEKIALDQIVPYTNNAKVHSEEQVKRLAKSINDFGFRSAILVTPVEDKYEIVAGHGRYLAVQELGHEDIYAEVITDLSEAQIKAMRLADNSTVSTEWDLEMFKDEYQLLEGEIEVVDYMAGDLWDDIFGVYEDQIENADKEEEDNQIKFTVTCETEKARDKAMKALFKIEGVNVD